MSTAAEKYVVTRYEMMAFSLMPMNLTERLGSSSSGMPAWCRPMTPWFFSPVRISRIELVRSSEIGILLQGKMGTPRQAGTMLPPTSTLVG